jgi:hypothetical protein
MVQLLKLLCGALIGLFQCSARREAQILVCVIWRRPFAPHRKPESPQFGVIRAPRGTI